MANDRLYKAASKKMTSWSKRTMPGYWTLLQYAVFAGFGIWAVVALVSDDPTPPPAATQQAPVSQGEQPSAPSSTNPTSVVADPVVTHGDEPMSSVLDVSGASVQVPSAALDMATAALRANFDPQVAASVPLVGGGTWPAPGRAFPQATVGSVALLSAEGDQLTFAAATDADGAGTTFASVTSRVSVVRDGDTWAAQAAS